MKSILTVCALTLFFGSAASADQLVCSALTVPAPYIASFDLKESAVIRGKLIVNDGKNPYAGDLVCEMISGNHELAYHCDAAHLNGADYLVRLYSSRPPEMFSGIIREVNGDKSPEETMPCRFEN